MDSKAYPSRREQFFSGSNVAVPPSSGGLQTTTKPAPPLSVLNNVDRMTNGSSENDTGYRKQPLSPAMTKETVPPPSAHQKENVILTTKGVTVKELHGYVGFANIPNQVYRKAIKRGFEFTLMVVGQSGLGKSTFMNSLFLTDFYGSKNLSSRKSTTTKTTQIEETTVKLVESGVSLVLTLCDTPGFGEAVDNSNCWDAIVQYVDRKNSEFFNEETKVNRKEKIPDHRVHCCLYFIAPTGHGLKALDIEFMKHLHERINIIPVIAKADTMTPEELTSFKQKIMKEIDDHKIKIYDFPEPDDESEKKEQKKMKQRVPFAVVGSNTIVETGGKKVRCRKYPWGVVEVENLEHNDFIALRNMIIRSNMIDLIDVTRCVHYENFRCRQLKVNSADELDGTKHPFATMEEQKKEHELSLKKKEAEMERVLQEKVAEKMRPLIEMEKKLDQDIKQHEKEIAEKRKELAERREKFEQEKLAFSQQYPEFHKYTSSDSLSLNDDKKKWKTSTLGSVFRQNKHHVDDKL